MKYMILVLILCACGCAKRPTHYDQLCEKFDSLGPQIIFTDAQRLIAEHYDPSVATNPRSYGIDVYPITNSLSIFGNSARISENEVTMRTAGLGSWKMGIIFVPAGTNGTNEALYYFTRNTGDGYTNKYVYPR